MQTRADLKRTIGKNCHAKEMSSQCSREGGNQPGTSVGRFGKFAMMPRYCGIRAQQHYDLVCSSSSNGVDHICVHYCTNQMSCLRRHICDDVMRGAAATAGSLKLSFAAARTKVASKY